MGDQRIDMAAFQKAAHEAVEWVTSYLTAEGVRPILSQVEPGSLRAALPAEAPAKGEPLDRLLADFERLILPGITHWNQPGFLAYFGNTGSPPAVLAELLAAALNANAMLWRTSPAATELEEVTLAWLARALGLPPTLFGVLTDTASVSTLVALAAARDVALPEARAHGLVTAARGRKLRLYASDQAHSSVDKAAVVLGLGLEDVIKVPSDEAFRMDPRALDALVARDREAGHLPFAIVATVGTTSTTSVDPVPAIADVAARHGGLWLHVDAAYGGAAAIVPELRHVLDGADRADSLVVNPHKWLLTPVDASALYTRRPEALRRAFSLVPDYLVTSDEGVVNYMDYGVQLGRRFRALKLWFVLRAYGTDGIAAILREHVRLAAALAERVDAHPDLERMAPAPLSVVCLRALPAELRARAHEAEVAAYLDRLNDLVIDRVNREGHVFLSHTRLGGKTCIRVAIGNARTDESHVRQAEEQVIAAARALHTEGAARTTATG